jgi:hypothetical protein
VPINGRTSSDQEVLPNWITFDQNNGFITFAPTSQTQIGSYAIYASISTQVLNSSFVGVASITDTRDSLNLLITLISLGYVDNEGYLTSSFDPTASHVASKRIIPEL